MICETLQLQQSSAAFDMGLGIASIFIVAAVSAVGFLLPSVIKNYKTSAAQLAIAGASAAGTGVLLCVALVHILSDAERSLSDPCLPEAFTAAFPDLATLVTAATIMLMVILDYLTQGYFQWRFFGELSDTAKQQQLPCPAKQGQNSGSLHLSAVNMRSGYSATTHVDLRASSMLLTAAFNGGLAPPVNNQDNQDKDVPAANELSYIIVADVKEPKGTDQLQEVPLAAPQQHTGGQESVTGHGHSHNALPAAASLALRRSAVLFVEISVCSHSIPVGLSLGLADAETFITLLIAVCIHQVLEGLGVGAAAVEGQFSSGKLALLTSAFSFTAPIGIALGVALRASLNQQDPRYLMTMGLVNAVACGMLLYVAIEHMNALSSHGDWLRQQSWWKQGLVLAAFIAGGAAMMVIGKWA